VVLRTAFPEAIPLHFTSFERECIDRKQAVMSDRGGVLCNGVGTIAGAALR